MSRGHTRQNENETSEVSETSEVLTVYMGEENGNPRPDLYDDSQHH
jgi:hypothetical protein